MYPYTYIYILGIGGYAMSALARWFTYQKLKVVGYDRNVSSITTQLIQEGIEIHFQTDITAIPQSIISNPSNSLIIHSAAIPHDHPILGYLKSKNYQVCNRTAILDQITQKHFTWAIAGTHGKTTTTALTTHILVQTQANVTAFLGGITKNYGSNLVIQNLPNQNSNIVIEADEFDRFFLSLHPNIAMITTVDPDHLDTYKHPEGFKQGFKDFLDILPKDGLAILHQQVAQALSHTPKHRVPIITYALKNAPVQAANIRIKQGIYYFDYISEKITIRDIPLKVPGYHNIENALAVITGCLFKQINPMLIRQAIATFTGTLRRFDYIIQQENLVFIDDYAHHPIEIAALLKATKQIYANKKIAIVFRPNLYTRTKALAAEFATSLDLADCVFLLDIYSDREQPIPGVSSEMIFHKLKVTKKYLCTAANLLDCLADYGKPEVILNVGSGGSSQFIKPIQQFLSPYC